MTTKKVFFSLILLMFVFWTLIKTTPAFAGGPGWFWLAVVTGDLESVPGSSISIGGLCSEVSTSSGLGLIEVSWEGTSSSVVCTVTASAPGYITTVEYLTPSNSSECDLDFIYLDKEPDPPGYNSIKYLGQDPLPNANGWNDSGVELSWLITEDGKTRTVHRYISSEGANQTINVSFDRNDGQGVFTDTVSGINIDKTPPELDREKLSPEPNENGWNSSVTELSWTCNDHTSGPVIAENVVPILTPGIGKVVQMVCADKAGNINYVNSTPVNIDFTPPYDVETHVLATLGTFNWYTSDVHVVTSGKDDLSEPVTCTDVLINTDGTGYEVTPFCENLAGLRTYTPTLAIKRDATLPHILLEDISPMPDYGSDWVTRSVIVRWRCWDDLSRALTNPVYKTVSTEGFNQSVTGTCYDIAGNSSSDTTHGINIDMTPPAGVRLVPTGLLGTNGWFVGDVSIATTSDGDISTPVVCTSDQTMTTDTASMTFYGSCTNAAALTSPTAEAIVKKDAAPPSIGFIGLSGVSGLNGWYLGDVTSTWRCTDTLSGPTQDQVSTVITNSGANLSAMGTCIDMAGNTSANTQTGIMIDSQPPTVNLVVNGKIGKNGWYTSDVKVSTEGIDTTSGIGKCSQLQVVSQDTPGEWITGECADAAGQSSEEKVFIKRDSIPPVITFLGRTPPGKDGWNTGPVTARWACKDATSGALASIIQVTLAEPGSNLSVSGRCVDFAGNTSFDTRKGINISYSGTPTLIPTQGNTNSENPTTVSTSLPPTESAKLANPTPTLAFTSTNLITPQINPTSSFQSSSTETVRNKKTLSVQENILTFLYIGSGIAGLGFIAWLVFFVKKRVG